MLPDQIEERRRNTFSLCAFCVVDISKGRFHGTLSQGDSRGKLNVLHSHAGLACVAYLDYTSNRQNGKLCHPGFFWDSAWAASGVYLLSATSEVFGACDGGIEVGQGARRIEAYLCTGSSL